MTQEARPKWKLIGPPPEWFFTDAEVLAEMPIEMLVLEIKRRQLPNGGIIFSDGTAFRLMEEVGDE
jgi:hypothetical protein